MKGLLDTMAASATGKGKTVRPPPRSPFGGFDRPARVSGALTHIGQPSEEDELPSELDVPKSSGGAATNDTHHVAPQPSAAQSTGAPLLSPGQDQYRSGSSPAFQTTGGAPPLEEIDTNRHDASADQPAPSAEGMAESSQPLTAGKVRGTDKNTLLDQKGTKASNGLSAIGTSRPLPSDATGWSADSEKSQEVTPPPQQRNQTAAEPAETLLERTGPTKNGASTPPLTPQPGALRREAPSGRPSSLQIRIGRIEVRPPAPPPTSQSAASTRPAPRPRALPRQSLDDFLAKRRV